MYIEDTERLIEDEDSEDSEDDEIDWYKLVRENLPSLGSYGTRSIDDPRPSSVAP
eukprot:SAG31_NODE_2788_length_5089_cov_7.201002_6_plen_55_part_00